MRGTATGEALDVLQAQADRSPSVERLNRIRAAAEAGTAADPADGPVQRAGKNNRRNRQIKRAKQHRNRIHAWSQLMQQRLGLAPVVADLYAQTYANNPAISFPALEAFINGTPGWAAPHRIGLINRFLGNAGGRSQAEWIAIAAAHPGLIDAEADVAALARIAGWNAGPLVGLAAAFAVNAGGRNVQDWAQVAVAGPALVDTAANVAGLCRLAGWGTPQLLTLVGMFTANPGGRTVADWTTIAGGHAVLANAPGDVAALARIAGWTVGQLVVLAGLFAANAGANALAGWCTIADASPAYHDEAADVAVLARIVAPPAAQFGALGTRWTSRGVADFVQNATAAGLGLPGLTALLGQAGLVAAGRAMHAAGWSYADLGGYGAGAMATGYGAAPVAALMAQPELLAPGFQLRGAAGWTPAAVGGFLAQARQQGLTAGRLHGILTAPGFMAAVGNFAPPLWAPVQLADCLAEARARGLGAAQIGTLLGQAGFAATGGAMLGAGWTAINLGGLVAGAIVQGLAVAGTQAALATAGLPAAALAWIGAGFTAQAVGQVIATARGQGQTAAALSASLATANMAASALALNGTWFPQGIGETIGYVRTRAGAPTNAELERLLHFAGAHAWAALSVRNAAQANVCGPPTWATVLVHAPIFAAQAPAALAPAGMGGAVLATQTQFYPAAGGNPAYRVRLRVRQERANHVWNGHSYEHFDLTYANCTRNANITLYPLGTNINALVQAHANSAGGMAIANNAAWAGFAQGVVGGDTLGVDQHGASFGHGVQTWPTYLTQVYPNGGITLHDTDMAAIGRLLGRFA